MPDASEPLEPILIVDRQRQPPPRRFVLLGSGLWKLSLWLFCMTCITTFGVGAVNGILSKASFGMVLAHGAAYSGTVMTILLAHEMGHYLQSVRYGVPATPPLFVPMPLPPLGTMGAVILQAPGYMDRRMLFDVAISGPLAGLVVAVPAVFWGASQLQVGPTPPGSRLFGDPLLVKAIVWLIHGTIPPNHDIFLAGIAGQVMFAGWVGCFITGLNLVPLGQLDGGHILYALIGRRQHAVAVWLFRLALLAIGISFMRGVDGGATMAPMLILVFLMGIRHPPSSNDAMPLGPVRMALGWMSMLLLVLCFVPIPIQDIPSDRNYPIAAIRKPA